MLWAYLGGVGGMPYRWEQVVIRSPSGELTLNILFSLFFVSIQISTSRREIQNCCGILSGKEGIVSTVKSGIFP